MATRIPMNTRVGVKDTTTTSAPAWCPPPCPACGGLQCLCRPRFFAGQLLTEQDLNRLDAYVRAKNRLHNRYVHGWGVVCGLEVTCHDCENLVRVSAGYGLSPCGDDVIVCDATTVDVCALIRACDRARRRPECEPPRPHDPTCEDVEQTWVLSVCYEEQPSRQVAALRATGCACGGGCGGAGGGGCGCGGAQGAGHGGCGCGCGGQGTANGSTNGSTNGSSYGTATATRSRVMTAADVRTAVQCEPTVICEGYRFRVYPAPEPVLDESQTGAMEKRVMACVQPFIDWARALFAANAAGAQKSQVERTRTCCRAKERLRALLLQSPRHDCELLAELDAIVCPAATLDPDVYAPAFGAAAMSLLLIWYRGLLACLCSGLLPPCPDPVDDDCIPLATVTVRKRDCHILRVCNWTVHRKFATTVPSLQYWFSILPYARYLRALLEEACCSVPDLGGRQDAAQPNEFAAAAAPRAATGAAAGAATGTTTGATTGATTAGGAMPFSTARTREMSTLLASAVLGRTTPLDAATLFRGVAETTRTAGTTGGRVLRDHERDNLPQYLLASQLLSPLVSALVPDDLGGLAVLARGAFAARGVSTGAGAASAAPAAGADVGSMRRELDDLRGTVERQREMIDRLNERLG